MKRQFNKYGPVAALVCALAAGTTSATELSVDVANQRLGGTFDASWDFLAAMDTAKMTMTSVGAAWPDVGKDTDGFYTRAAVSMPLVSVGIDDVQSKVLTEQFSGGFTLTAPKLKSVSTGGTLTVTDLTVDVASKAVYGTVSGSNGLGTLSNVKLMYAMGSAAGPSVTWSVPTCGPGVWDCMGSIGSAPTVSLSGLYLTTEGFDAFAKGLGLVVLGRTALSSVTDIGSLTVAVVPEPASYALMSVGLAGVLLVARRKAIHSS